MENTIRNIVEKYFSPSEIESIGIFKQRVIITLQNVAEDKEKSAQLAEEVKKLEGIDKVSVVCTALKKNQPLNEAPAKWNVKGVKKIIAKLHSKSIYPR